MPIKKIVLFVLFILLLIEGIVVLYPDFSKPQRYQSSSLQKFADEIFSKCKNSSYRPTCYDKEVPKTMKKVSLEQAFEIVRLIQKLDPGAYEYCHVVGHKLSAEETKKNPDKWKDVITRCPSGLCSNGCIHGAFQERFRTESMTDAQIKKIQGDLEAVCEPRGSWKPTGLEQATCYHAIGHLLMYVTKADADKASSFCDQIAMRFKRQNLLNVCYDGVFMQIFQPLEPEDFSLIKGKEIKKEQHVPFCNRFDAKKRASCLNEGWPLYFDEIRTPQGLLNFCDLQATPSSKDRCFHALFYVLTAQFNFDETKIKNLCNDLPEKRKGDCYANAASRFIETDRQMIQKSIELCKYAQTVGVGDRCFNELIIYSTFNFHKRSSDYFSLCNGLPQPWKSKCLK